MNCKDFIKLNKNTIQFLKKWTLLVNYWNENAKKLFEKLGLKLWFTSSLKDFKRNLLGVQEIFER